jgi:Caspase domain
LEDDVTVSRGLVAALLLLPLTIGAALAQTEQRVALVIGNGNYVNFNRLKNPASDATAVATTLRGVGFQVIEQENLTRRTMIQAIRSFTDKLSPGGIALLFYAGHGIQSQGANYLLPTDAVLAVEDDLKYEAIDLQDILNKLGDARVRLSLVILDACRDNPFKAFRTTVHGLAPIDPPRGTIIAYSTSPGKVAADGSGANSVYTAELIRAIQQPGWKLMEVFEHVAESVERETNNAQTPWINSSFRGDFYFIGPTTVLPPAPASLATPEIVFWQSIAASTNPTDFEAYLQQYPQGSFALLAKARIASLRPTVSVPSPPADLEAALREALSMVNEVDRVSQARHYMTEADTRAMAVAPKRAASWRVFNEPDNATAATRALEGCQIFANEPCMLVALGDKILPKTAAGSWPTQPQSHATYQGDFDPDQVPVAPTIRSAPPVAGYLGLAGPKALAYHPWGRIFLGAASDLVTAEKLALNACNADRDRKGANGPCFLYAIGDEVVLPSRLAEPSTKQ